MVDVLSEVMANMRWILFCGVPGVRLQVVTPDGLAHACTIPAKVNLSVTYQYTNPGNLSNTEVNQSQEAGYNMHRRWCAPESCMIIEKKRVYTRVIESLGLLGGLYSIWLYFLVNVVWNVCLKHVARAACWCFRACNCCAGNPNP